MKRLLFFLILILPFTLYGETTMENFKNAQPNVEFAYLNSMKYEMNNTFQLFHEMFERLYEN